MMFGGNLADVWKFDILTIEELHVSEGSEPINVGGFGGERDGSDSEGLDSIPNIIEESTLTGKESEVIGGGGIDILKFGGTLKGSNSDVNEIFSSFGLGQGGEGLGVAIIVGDGEGALVGAFAGGLRIGIRGGGGMEFVTVDSVKGVTRGTEEVIR